MTQDPTGPIHVDYELALEQLPLECIKDCGTGSGAKDDDVQHWREQLQFTVNRANAVKCLRGYGAWDDEQLAAKSDDDIADIVMWLACCNFAEFLTDPNAGSDIYVLE